jgi:hypothetical protein
VQHAEFNLPWATFCDETLSKSASGINAHTHVYRERDAKKMLISFNRRGAQPVLYKTAHLPPGNRRVRATHPPTLPLSRSLPLVLSGCIYPKSLFEVGFIAGRAGAATLVQRIPPQGALKKDEPQTFACFLEEESQKMSLRRR